MFKFSLGQQVNVGPTDSQEHGEVIARAEYKVTEPAYLIRYRAEGKGLTECWWAESALTTRS